MAQKLTLEGLRFGRWFVLREDGKIRTSTAWLCRCDCGTERRVAGGMLNFGATTSCGCRTRENRLSANTTHGMSKTRIYRIWKGMLRRCNGSKASHRKYYSDRGIKVCERWLNFDRFLEDMEANYRDGLTIERVNNNGDYEPGNCTWIPANEQQKNREFCVVIDTPLGRIPIGTAARLSGISYCALKNRVRKGWATERLFDPARPGGRKKKVKLDAGTETHPA